MARRQRVSFVFISFSTFLFLLNIETRKLRKLHNNYTVYIEKSSLEKTKHRLDVSVPKKKKEKKTNNRRQQKSC